MGSHALTAEIAKNLGSNAPQSPPLAMDSNWLFTKDFVSSSRCMDESEVVLSMGDIVLVLLAFPMFLADLQIPTAKRK